MSLSAVGALFLLRGQEQRAAEERVGRLAEPLNLAVALLEQGGASGSEIHSTVQDYAQSFNVRVLLVDAGTGRVAYDTTSDLNGETVDSFLDPDGKVTRRGDAEFRMEKYRAEGGDLLLFAPPGQTIHLSTNRAVQLQAYAFVAGDLSELLAELAAQPQAATELQLPRLRPLVAVSEDEISSAWQDVVPPLAFAGALALAASAAIAVLVARSITGRLARVTRASREMAAGNYDQHLDVSGQDEVARLAQSFNVMAEKVSGSHQMMRDLLANVSHELRTPLTSIQGFSQAMEEGAITSEDEYRQAGKIINEETQRMRSLVDDLIELSRLESGEVVMLRESVDLADLLRACAGRFEWQLREANVALSVDVPALPQIDGDGRRLEQVFTNLIDNALRHTGSDGAVALRAETNDGVVRVGVHNTGSYIPPDKLSRVFERFYQVDQNRARQGGGAGLGLSIVTEVIQAHGGSIAATSDRDAGTEFVVTLPVRAKAT